MGEWKTVFEAGVRAEPGTHLALAIVAVKHELIYAGTPLSGMQLDVPSIGKGTAGAIRRFQRAHGLTPDGACGRETAAVLFRPRGLAIEKQLGLPGVAELGGKGGLLCKTKELESDNDPDCLSDDKKDRALMQINADSHPDVSDEEAWDPAFSMPWAGHYLRAAFDAFRKEFPKEPVAVIWQIALAAYNVGWGGARKWQVAGRPQKNPDGSANVAWRYVHVVLGRAG